MDGLRGRKADRRIRFTKICLREALLRLMREKPIGKITPTELCREADINRNTFYAHYASPSDLLREIEEELSSDIISCISVYMESTLKMDDLCRAIRDHADLCSVIFSDHGDSAFLLRLIMSAHDITVAEWKRRSPGMDERELDSFFTYCAGGSVAVIREWVCGGRDLSHERVARILETANSAVLDIVDGKGDPDQ